MTWRNTWRKFKTQLDLFTNNDHQIANDKALRNKLDS